MKREATVVLAVVTAILLIGQIVAYYADTSHFSISSETEGGTVNYTVRSSADTEYTELHLNNVIDAPTSFFILNDDGYATLADSTSIEPTGYFLEDSFGRFGSISMGYRNVDEILAMMEEDISTGTHDTGIIVMSGALPSPWYDGTAGSKVIQWLNTGGFLYWAGEPFGKYISTPEGIETLTDYHTTVCTELFGAENVFNDSDSDSYGTERVNPELTGIAGMYYANLRFGIDVTKLSSQHIELGYTDGTYCSNSIVKYGAGSLCLFGGYVNYQIVEYMVHELFLGLTYSTEIVDTDSGSIKHGSHSGSFDESFGTSHFLIVHDVRWYRGWAYDPASKAFV